MSTFPFASLPWYLDAADTIRAIYQEELSREPEPEGLFSWIFHCREEGKDAGWIRAQIRESAEWHQKHDVPPVPPAPPRPPLESLARIRGAMWTQRLNLPMGPRPGHDDNILAMDYYEWYGAEDRKRMIEATLAAGYTHAVTGPFFDQGGYHGCYPTQTTLDQRAWDHYLDALQEWRDAKIEPVYFHKPDNWENDARLDALDALCRQPRAQELIRVVVYPGWEPSGSKYGWKNSVYVDMLQRGADVFPNALRGLHTVADLDAPIGGDDDPVAKLPNGKAVAWQNVLPYMHCWFVQVGGYVETGSPTPTPAFLAEFKKLWPDYNRRFQTDAGGWHFPSAWSNGRPVLVGYAEGASYLAFWSNAPESVAQDLGDLAMSVGSAFYLDGGRVVVP